MTTHLLRACTYVDEGDLLTPIQDDDFKWDHNAAYCAVCVALLTRPKIDPTNDDGRAIWATACKERSRLRQALYALGFERTGVTTNIRAQEGDLMYAFDELFVGPMGSVLVGWGEQ